MVYPHRFTSLSFALAATAAGGLLVSSEGAAQSFRQSLTTISPALAARPDPRQPNRRARQRGSCAPKSIGELANNSRTFPQATPVPFDRTPNAPSSGSALGGLRSSNIPGTQTDRIPIVSQQEWRTSQTLSRQPVEGSRLSNGLRPTTEVSGTTGRSVAPNLETIAVAPNLSRRRRQVHRFEPYTATGLRVGTFVLLPEVEVGTNWSSNIFNSPVNRSDHAYVLRPIVRIVSNWRRHAVELRGSSNLSFHDTFRSEDDRSYQLKASGRLDLTRRMNFEALASRSVAQETRGGVDATAGAADSANETTDTFALTFNRRFNRLSVQLRGVVTDFDADEAEAVTGGLISNDDEDYREVLGALRLAWEFKPTLSLFREVIVGQQEHDQVASSDGLSRSSDLRRYRAGVTVGNAQSIWDGEFAIGYGRNDLRDNGLADIDGILLDGTITWRPTALTSLLLTAQTDLAETRLSGSGGSRDYQAGAELRHAFRLNVIGTAGISYNMRDFDSSSLEEKTWLLTGGVEYFMNRNVSPFSRYQHERFDTNSDNGDYRDNTVNVGLRLRC